MAISTDITLLIGTRTGSYFIPDIISIHWTLKTAIISPMEILCLGGKTD